MIPWPDDDDDQVRYLAEHQRLNRHDRPIGERILLVGMVLFGALYLVCGAVGAVTIWRALLEQLR
jgi:hypothetical protein